MNTRCIRLAKKAVHRASVTGIRRKGTQLLPHEDTAVFVDNRKLTRDLAKTVRYKAGKEQTHTYFINQQGWTGRQYDEMDWNILHGALQNKPKGYKT